MGAIFEGKGYERVRFDGVELLRAREAAGLSQKGLADRMIAAGIETLEGRKVCQRRIGKMESQGFTLDGRVAKLLQAILAKSG